MAAGVSMMTIVVAAAAAVWIHVVLVKYLDCRGILVGQRSFSQCVCSIAFLAKAVTAAAQFPSSFRLKIELENSTFRLHVLRCSGSCFKAGSST